MKPTGDPKVDYKALVARGYDTCAEAYDAARREKAEQALTMLMNRLGEGAVVLDVGCGAGVPVAQTLAHRFSVTGVDISGRMIDRARMNVPEGTFIHEDIMSVDWPASHFDAVVAFYSIFHLPREDHEALLRRIHRWLNPGGYLMATVGTSNEAGCIEDDFFGVKMYWSHYGVEAYKGILAGLGFDCLDVTIIGNGYEERYQMAEERHPLIVARKRTEEA
jgi:ubiquinone/menaquinone biosynthesis C-methylase UbiE